MVGPRPEADPHLAIHRARPLRDRAAARALLRGVAAHRALPDGRLPVLRRLHPPQHRHERLRGRRHHAEVTGRIHTGGGTIQNGKNLLLT